MTDQELYKNIYLGIAYDTMRVLGYKVQDFYIDIKPAVYNGQTLLGQAFTTYGEVVEVTTEEYANLDSIRLEMYDNFSSIHNIYKLEDFPPIVLLQSNDKKVAHSGDVTSLIYKKLGVAGFITDGNVRDIDKIKEIGFTTFCNSCNPIDAIDYWALNEYNIDIQIKGVDISPADIIIASSDGVIRVPVAIWSDFKSTAKEILNKENVARDFINKYDFKSSSSIGSDFVNLVDDIGRW